KWPPYVRLPSMMAPTAVMRGEKVELLLGSAGSNRIRSAITNVILNYTVFGRSVEESIELPRLHYEKKKVFLEPGYSELLFKAIEKHYQLILFKERNMFFGGVQAVDLSYNGAGDPRRGGVFIKL
ncbi:gamma-glutamyltransferase, partial [Thermovibrio sp.]